ncbi:MAG: GPO family capsid scaffolding protein, partial [Vibrio sp.]
MFKSEPICILKAGPTIDGRNIPQKVIDDIAETYDPKHYTARINDDHCVWSAKGGSVLSVEKRGDELWAEIKPNSHLLRNIENGQLLHTSCEYIENFA